MCCARCGGWPPGGQTSRLVDQPTRESDDRIQPRHGSIHEATHRDLHGASAVPEPRDPTLCPPGLAGDPARGSAGHAVAQKRCQSHGYSARRSQPLHRRTRGRRRPPLLLYRSQRGQGSHRAESEGSRRPRAAAAPDQGAGRRRLLLQHAARALPGAGHRLRYAAGGQARPHLGRHLRHGAGFPECAGLRSRHSGHGRVHGGHRCRRRARLRPR